MSNSESPNELGVSGVDSTTSAGAVMVPQYAARNVTYYAINERELSEIAQFNSGVTFCWALCTFLTGIAFSAWVSVAVSDRTSPFAQAMAKIIGFYFSPLTLTLAVAFGAYAYKLMRDKQNAVQLIRREATKP
jgi:hypothetical protein